MFTLEQSLPHRRCLAVLATFICLTASARAQAPADKLELRLRLKQGETYRLKTTVEQKIDQTVGDKRKEIEQTLGLGYGLTVESVDGDGNVKVATKYDSVLFRQKGPGGVVEYDSANPPRQVPPPARPFAALAGLGFRITITPAGKVTKVEGLDEMFAEMVRRLELPAGPARAAVQKVLAEQFGQEAMKQQLQNMFAIYPDKPVAAGESWQRRVVVSKGFPIEIEATYTLKGRSGGVARIETKATISPNDAAGPVELGTGKMSYELRGEQRGVAEVDEATGWTRSLATQQTLTGTLRFEPGGDSPPEVSPVTIHEKLTMEAVT